MPADNVEEESGSQLPRLDGMRSEFLVAQQRRRERAPDVAPRPDDTDDGPPPADPADERPSAIAAVRRGQS
jgi:hypothetical protein